MFFIINSTKGGSVLINLWYGLAYLCQDVICGERGYHQHGGLLGGVEPSFFAGGAGLLIPFPQRLANGAVLL